MMDNRRKIDLLESAMRHERDALRGLGPSLVDGIVQPHTRAANALNSYLQEADDESKLRLYGFLTQYEN